MKMLDSTLANFYERDLQTLIEWPTFLDFGNGHPSDNFFMKNEFYGQKAFLSGKTFSIGPGER